MSDKKLDRWKRRCENRYNRLDSMTNKLLNSLKQIKREVERLDELFMGEFSAKFSEVRSEVDEINYMLADGFQMNDEEFLENLKGNFEDDEFEEDPELDEKYFASLPDLDWQYFENQEKFQWN